MKPLTPLTSRHMEILKLIAQGMSNKEIGAHLGIAAQTVASHKLMIAARLGARNSAQMVAIATQRGLI